MNLENFKIYISGILPFFLLILLTYFLLTSPSKNKVSNKMFALFLILNAIEISGNFTPFFIKNPKILIFLNSLYYFQFPVFFLYVKSVCFSDFKLKWTQLIHGLPFLIGSLLLIPEVYFASSFNVFDTDGSYKELLGIKLNYLLLHGTVIFYLFLCFRLLYVFKTRYFENYSNNEIRVYTWLFQLSVILGIEQFVALLKNISHFFSNNYFYELTSVGVGLIVILITSWYVINALKYPEIFQGIPSSLQKTTLSENTKIISKSAELFPLLESYMENHKPFLNADLSLENLAEAINMKPKELSILINHNSGSHFFDFINAYRINEAKHFLQKHEKKTILEVLYDVGFNSKSSFNTAFKKHTKTTPTAFRKALKK